MDADQDNELIHEVHLVSPIQIAGQALSSSPGSIIHGLHTVSLPYQITDAVTKVTTRIIVRINHFFNYSKYNFRT